MIEASSLPSLSVIIPTYNRGKELTKALNGYLAQSTPELIHELIVIDDGSTDSTEAVVQEFSKRSTFPIRYLRQTNKGPAAARNLGIREARSALVLFTDSDIIPVPDLVEQHTTWHQRNPRVATAVLGYVTWAPEVHPTPFMRWYGERMIFGFSLLQDKPEASFHHFYTCNISLKAEFLRTCGQFDEDFKSAAYEDTELGYRLSEKGLQLLYNSDAIAYHYQFFSFEDACRKTLGNAAAAQLFYRKEGGRQVLKEIQEKRSRFGYGFAKNLASFVAWLLYPARRLLNSHVPLPNIFYQLFYWDSTRQSNEQIILAALGHETGNRTL
jgi:glycosyltransferase involved in cell wall biosynthesis